jgi:tetratricopeptide (TPR) repeat protein
VIDTSSWATRTADASLYLVKGELLAKLDRKQDALAAYQKAMDNAYNNAAIFPDFSEKFKALGRADLSAQAMKKHAEQLAKMEADRKRQEAAQKAFSTGASSSSAGSGEGETITVKTGAADPKTGKPKIVSVTKGDGKGGKAAAATGNAPAKP